VNVVIQMVHTRVACRVYTALADEAGAMPPVRARLLAIIPLLCTQLATVIHAAEGACVAVLCEMCSQMQSIII
jgi:hypothetical protein